MKKFERIFKYLAVYKGKLLLYFLFTVLSVVFSVISLAALAPFLDIIFNPGHQQPIKSGALGFFAGILNKVAATDKMQALLLVCGIMIVATLLKNLFLYFSYYISAPIRSAVTTRLREDLFAKILIVPIGYFTEQKKGDVISRMTNDVGEIEGSVVSTLEGLIKDPLTIIAYLGFLVYTSPSLSLFLLILLPITAFIIGRLSRTLKKQSNSASVKLGEVLAILDETLSGIRVLKAFRAEHLLKNKFNGINDDLFKIRKQMSARRDLASPLTELLGVLVLCTILYFGGRLVLVNGTLNGGDLIAYIAIFAMIINPAKALSTSFFNIQRGAAAIERVEEILNETNIVEQNGTRELTSFNNNIEFKNVAFAYGDKGILKNINLTIPKGKMVALVGSSGAGKSTLADLVPRFHDVTNGELLIDGVNVKEYTLDSLRSHISIVTQEPILFNDTIAHNIALGVTDAKKADVVNAAKVANALSFIETKEQQFDTNIGDRGMKLSGGERQRLTIARAVLKNPPILILDEATSSLDTESERLVQDAINNMMQNRTSLVIAHRLSTVRHADEIIVLHKGEIAERGTHDELLLQNGIYKKLVDMQEVK